MKKKIVAFILVFALALALGIGGTVAWLVDKKTVTNTFTFGDINIKLTETGVDGETVKSKTFDSLVPGEIVAKDPMVTVVAGSETCYIFVKIEEQNNSAGEGEKYINWDVNSDWKLVAGETNVYQYKDIVDASEVKKELYILQNDKTGYENGYVTVDEDNVTKKYVTDLKDEDQDIDPPALVFTAFAVQSDNLADQNDDKTVDAADAWALVSAN